MHVSYPNQNYLQTHWFMMLKLWLWSCIHVVSNATMFLMWCKMFACHYRVVSGVLLVVFCGISSGVWSELSRVFIELRVSDRDIKTLSKTELGSESSVSWRALRTPFTGSPFCSSSLKRALRYINRYQLPTINRTSKAKQHNLVYRSS